MILIVRLSATEDDFGTIAANVCRNDEIEELPSTACSEQGASALAAITDPTPLSESDKEVGFLLSMFPHYTTDELRDMLALEPLDKVVTRLCRPPKRPKAIPLVDFHKAQSSPSKSSPVTARGRTVGVTKKCLGSRKEAGASFSKSLRDIMQEQAIENDGDSVGSGGWTSVNEGRRAASQSDCSFASRTKQLQRKEDTIVPGTF